MTPEMQKFYAGYVLAQTKAIRDTYGPAKLTSMWLDYMNSALSAGYSQDTARTLAFEGVRDEVHAAEEASWLDS